MRLLPSPLAELSDRVRQRFEDVSLLAPDRRRRHVVEGNPGRAYLSVKAVHRPDGEAVASAVEGALTSLRGVHWAQVNPLLAHVLVAFDDEEVSLEDLTEAIEEVEAFEGVDGEEFCDVPLHSADTTPLRRGAVSLVSDAAGIGMGIAARVLRFPRLPVEVASALPALDSVPQVRRLLIDRPGLETSLSILSAVLQGLGQGPLGLVVDASDRASALAEELSRRRAWLAVEDRLYAKPQAQRPLAWDGEERPTPLPSGPIEIYGERASQVSLAGGGLTLALTRDPRRTADVLLAGLPRAARAGREGFAAQIGRTLGGRRVLTMDPAVLRRLDRIDTVVLDEAVLRGGRFALGRLETVGALDATATERMAHALFDPADPTTTVSEGRWTLSPAASTEGRWPRGSKVKARALAGVGSEVLALSDRGAVVGLVEARPELSPSGRALVAAVRCCGHLLVVAGSRSGLGPLVDADRVMAGGSRLAASVRALQAEGRVVALVSGRPGAPMKAADCSIGLVGTEHEPPWGAHLLCFRLGEAAPIIEATAMARAASRQAVALAAAGSVAAGVLALGPLPGAGRRAVTAVQLTSLAALTTGTFTGARLPAATSEPDAFPVPWHALSEDEVLRRLQRRLEGLSSAPHAPSLDDEVPRHSFAALVGAELMNPLSMILGAGAAVSAAVGSVVDAGLIAGVLGVDALIGALQRVQTERAIAALTATLESSQVRALRDGQPRLLSPRELVVGDLVELAAGDAVPADGRLLEATGLELDDSSLTGESLPVAKGPSAVRPSTPVADRTSMVYGGTVVAAGRGTAVVVATGADTEARRGAETDQSPETGVEHRLRALTDKTVPAVLAAGGALTANGLLRGQPLRQAVTSGVSLAAAAVPEGLPFVATVAQAATARRLSGRGVLVRNPRVLEALGRVDVLCFDKTGTLTEGHLQVRVVSDGRQGQRVEELDGRHREVLAAALRATPRPRAGGLPHPTDQAVVEGAALAHVRAGRGQPGWKKLGSLPFEPGRAYHAVVGSNRKGSVLSVKGAPEVVLPRCQSVRHHGDSAPLDAAAVKAAEAEVERLARQGLRVLAVAERAGPTRATLDDDEVSGLALLGFLGVADVARPTASAPLAQFHRAGINVVMITGDHPSTAEAIASELGLLNGRGVLTGPELDSMDDGSLDQAIDNVAVFARVTPAHKVRIVGAFQRAGRVVAMTGDGANDAQAIRLAEIGVAFGPRATGAARESADLVVTHADVQVLIETIAECRAMWASVRNALSLLLGGNLGEVAFTTGAAFTTGQSPLSPRQLLAVNLFTDLAPAMAMAVQAPRTHHIDLAKEGPETSLAGPLAREVVIRAVATSSSAFGAWWVARMTGTPTRARTVALAALVGTQLGQTLLVGRRDPLVAGTAVASAAGLMAVIQIPGVSQFFDCRPLGPVGWATAGAASAFGTVAAAVASMASS